MSKFKNVSPAAVASKRRGRTRNNTVRTNATVTKPTATTAS